MKKIILLIFCMALLVGTASAFEFDNVKEYDPESKKITINNAFGLPLIGYKLAEYTLEYNTDQCFDCWASGTATLYTEDKLFKELKILDYEGKKIKLERAIITIKEIETITYEVEDKEYYNCREIELGENFVEEVCDSLVVGTHNESYQREVWKEYDFKKLLPGEYEWKIRAKLEMGERADWIVNAFGKDLTEWAWFNNNWGSRRNISITSTVDTENEMLENINVTGLTLATDDCDELRITNSTGDEIPYNVTNNGGQAVGDGSEWCVIRITTNALSAGVPVNYSAYYNNALATTPSYDRRGGEHYKSSNNLQIMRLSDATAFKGISAGISGAPTFVADSVKFSNAMKSAAVNDGLFWNPTSFGDASKGTAEFWFNFTDTGTYLFDNEDPRIAFFYVGTTFHFDVGGGDSTVVFALGAGQVSHIAITWDDVADKKGIYIDGVRIMDAAMAGDHGTYGSGNMTLARRFGISAGSFLSQFGVYDEFMLSNFAKTSFIGKNVTFTIGVEELNPSVIIVSVVLDVPANDTSFNVSTVHFQGNYTSTNGNLTNATLSLWNANGTLIDTNTTNIGGTSNSSNLSLSNVGPSMGYLWNYEACAINASGSRCAVFAASNRTVNIEASVESTSFLQQAYETDVNSFSTVVGFESAPTNGFFTYNGTETAATIASLGGDRYNLSSRITVPLIATGQNRSFNFEFNLGGFTQTLSSLSHRVDNINLSLCGVAPQNQAYINFTFKNETVSQESLDATITSSWTYWLSTDATANLTLSFSNASENPSYGFCFSPGNKTVNVDYSLSYNNAQSQQRTFIATSVLSNVTTNQVLYLLPTISGLFSQFITQDTVGNTLAGVKAVITRILGASTITISSGSTDDSGFISFFLDPDVTYTALFTLTSFADNQFSFVPTTDSRTVIMGSSTLAPNGSIISLGTAYEIRPKNDTLLNSTNYDFELEVASNQTITLISMNITNDSGFQLAFDSDTSEGTLSATLNTSNNQTILGFYRIQTANETIRVTKRWIVSGDFVGDYSLFKQLSLFTEYNFDPLWQYLIVILSIVVVVLFMSSNETLDSSESKILVAILIIWGWSIVGWLDNPAVTSTTGLAQFGRQYGIALLSTFAGTIFILRRLFRLITI